MNKEYLVNKGVGSQGMSGFFVFQSESTSADFCSSLKRQICPDIPHLTNIEIILGKNRPESNLNFLEIGERTTSVLEKINCWLAPLLLFFSARGLTGVHKWVTKKGSANGGERRVFNVQ